MNRRLLTTLLGLVLTSAALFWVVNQGCAQSQAPAQPQTAPRTTITDAAGRVHNVKPMRSITPAQRKAAAKRLMATPAERAKNAAERGKK